MLKQLTYFALVKLVVPFVPLTRITQYSVRSSAIILEQSLGTFAP